MQDCFLSEPHYLRIILPVRLHVEWATDRVVQSTTNTYDFSHCATTSQFTIVTTIPAIIATGMSINKWRGG
jgi:hypothetical protein